MRRSRRQSEAGRRHRSAGCRAELPWLYLVSPLNTASSTGSEPGAILLWTSWRILGPRLSRSLPASLSLSLSLSPYRPVFHAAFAVSIARIPFSTLSPVESFFLARAGTGRVFSSPLRRTNDSVCPSWQSAPPRARRGRPKVVGGYTQAPAKPAPPPPTPPSSASFCTPPPPHPLSLPILPGCTVTGPGHSCFESLGRSVL